MEVATCRLGQPLHCAAATSKYQVPIHCCCFAVQIQIRLFCLCIGHSAGISLPIHFPCSPSTIGMYSANSRQRECGLESISGRPGYSPESPPDAEYQLCLQPLHDGITEPVPRGQSSPFECVSPCFRVPQRRRSACASPAWPLWA